MLDFIVVGAGPAGLSVAEILGKEGMKTAVIERKRDIGRAVECGEGLTGHELKNIGFAKKFILWKGSEVELVFPTGSMFVKRDVFSIDRASMERLLAERAEANGVMMRTNEGVIGLKKQGKFWKIKSTRGTYEARYIVGADGFSSFVGSALGLYREREIIAGTSVRVKDNEDTEGFRFFFSERYPHGYAYIFPRGNGFANAGVVIKGKHIYEENARFLRENSLKALELRGGGIPMYFVMKSIHSWRSLLVGDAAGLTDPVTYGGIYPAIMSGRIAARSLLKAAETDAENLHTYERDIRSSDFYHSNSKRYHNLVYGMKNKDLELIGEIAGGGNLEDISIAKAFKEIIKKGRLASLPRLFILYNHFKKM